MAPSHSSDRNNVSNTPTHNPGPHPSYIQVAKPYLFEQKLQESMAAVGAVEGKADTIRLQGVAWIDSVRKALQLPVRTYNTACVYFHKFRLVHSDNEYDYRDVAAAALFNACKIEDTLKKSRDILCAAYNMKLPTSEQLSSDDAIFEAHAKTIVGLERLMLEASGFDFRNRYPQKILMKLVKSCSLKKETVGLKAYQICLDLYRTFTPIKQTTQTMALSCLELSARLCDVDLASITSEYGFDYDKWATSREEIMETLLDLLDLYIHHRSNTLVGPEHHLDIFIQIRITLNQEATSHGYPRFSEWNEKPKAKAADSKKNGSHPKSGHAANGAASTSTSKSPQSPSDVPKAAGERGKEGTIRFMLDPARARDEKSMVKEYFRGEEVEEIYKILEPLSEVSEASTEYSPPPPAISIPSTESSVAKPSHNISIKQEAATKSTTPRKLSVKQEATTTSASARRMSVKEEAPTTSTLSRVNEAIARSPKLAETRRQSHHNQTKKKDKQIKQRQHSKAGNTTKLTLKLAPNIPVPQTIPYPRKRTPAVPRSKGWYEYKIERGAQFDYGDYFEKWTRDKYARHDNFTERRLSRLFTDDQHRSSGCSSHLLERALERLDGKYIEHQDSHHRGTVAQRDSHEEHEYDRIEHKGHEASHQVAPKLKKRGADDYDRIEHKDNEASHRLKHRFTKCEEFESNVMDHKDHKMSHRVAPELDKRQEHEHDRLDHEYHDTPHRPISRLNKRGLLYTSLQLHLRDSHQYAKRGTLALSNLKSTATNDEHEDSGKGGQGDDEDGSGKKKVKFLDD